MEKNPYNPITEPASHKWWEETKKGTLTIAHQKKLTHEEQVEANEKLLVKIKEDVISLGERLIAKNQELSELQEKYNKLEEAFRELLENYIPMKDHFEGGGLPERDRFLIKAGLKEQ